MKGLECLKVINYKKELFRLMNPQNGMLINSLTRINIGYMKILIINTE